MGRRNAPLVSSEGELLVEGSDGKLLVGGSRGRFRREASMGIPMESAPGFLQRL